MPAALAISAFAPWAVTPLLMVGGAVPLLRRLREAGAQVPALPGADERASRRAGAALTDPASIWWRSRKDKIKGAIRTDFILSAEIIVITLGTVAARPSCTRIGVLAGIAMLMTVGVYGLVAGIVKLDDVGLALSALGVEQHCSRVGRAILVAAPWLMKALSIAGTAAMFLVGGGILTHGIPACITSRRRRCTASRAHGHAGQLGVRWARRNSGRSDRGRGGDSVEEVANRGGTIGSG